MSEITSNPTTTPPTTSANPIPPTTTNATSSTSSIASPLRQEDKNRKLLEDLKTRQLQLKNSSLKSGGAQSDSGISGAGTPTMSVGGGVGRMMEMQTSITFLPTNSQFGNQILPIFPRLPPD